MAGKRLTTIGEYIGAAPGEGLGHLTRVYEILKGVLPEAEEAVKWGMPFFIEPRFVIAFSAHKAHLSIAPIESAFEALSEELKGQERTKKLVKFSYKEPLPEGLIRRLAEYCWETVREREDEGFW